MYSAPAASLPIVEWARSLIHEAFTEDVRRAHTKLAIEEFVERAGPLKSKFTNDATTKRLCQELITAMGCDPEINGIPIHPVYGSLHRRGITTGVSYSYKPHRDTWYAHPTQLINYWVPVYDSEATTVMSMYVDFFQKPVENGSETGTTTSGSRTLALQRRKTSG